MKRITSMLLALVMAFALAVPAFAAEAEPRETISVKFTLQTADNLNFATTLSGLTNVQTYATNVTVYVSADATVKDAVDALAGTTNVVWEDVTDIHGQPAKVLNSLTYGRVTHTNYGTSTGDSTHGTYSGNSWEYFVNGTYPSDKYMDQYAVANGDVITLSFDYSSFSW